MEWTGWVDGSGRPSGRLDYLRCDDADHVRASDVAKPFHLTELIDVVKTRIGSADDS